MLNSNGVLGMQHTDGSKRLSDASRMSVKVTREVPTGQTTVNKKAPIHYIIPINDTVHRPL